MDFPQGWLGHVKQRPEDGYYVPCSEQEAEAWISPSQVQAFKEGKTVCAHPRFPVTPGVPPIHVERHGRLPRAKLPDYENLSQADLDAIHAFIATGFFTSHGDLMELVGKLLAAYEDRE